MAKKKQQQQPKAAAVPSSENDELEDDDDESVEDVELELLQVDLGDMIKMKQILDETVAAAIMERLEEDHRLDNIKLSLMTAACLFAMVAQFAPVPFPDSRPILGVCCCCYFFLSGIMQLITTFIDKDSILLTKPISEATKKRGDKKPSLLQKEKIRVRTQFPRFSEFYTLILEYQEEPEKKPMVEAKWSVGQFFDEEGFFDEVGLQKSVLSLLTRLEKGENDKKKKKTE
ncbi:unnamed protein product [Cylindrotheca closterium]|uniref:Signal peptidase complex subunit 2 n=1 Tax=Cylindrotheca closterium TaxID=2856 RepID=A0AAD2JHG2_9STRA|nr:unnamed protein product [Cylindrotheca closterium]